MEIYKNWKAYLDSKQDAYLDPENTADCDIFEFWGAYYVIGKRDINAYEITTRDDDGITTTCAIIANASYDDMVGYCSSNSYRIRERLDGGITYDDIYTSIIDAVKVIDQYVADDRNGDREVDYDIVTLDGDIIPTVTTVSAIRYGEGVSNIVDIYGGKDREAAVAACERDWSLLSYAEKKRVDRYVVEEWVTAEGDEDLTDDKRTYVAVANVVKDEDGIRTLEW